MTNDPSLIKLSFWGFELPITTSYGQPKKTFAKNACPYSWQVAAIKLIP